MKDNINIYESWLITIANTRLIFNRMEEMEEFFDATIHGNGVKRMFTKPQQMRSAFRDLTIEVLEQTEGYVVLENILMDYKQAWTFYKENLARRSNPETLPMDLLIYCYSPNMRTTVAKKRQEIFGRAVDEGVSTVLLLLIMMKALPGYDSREGDPEDFAVTYEKVMQLLAEFTGSSSFDILPAISRAREEAQKTRMKLIYHTANILSVYDAFVRKNGLYEQSETMKRSLVDMDLDGYWNECGGALLNSQFWHFQRAEMPGTYFATYWEKDADNNLKGTRYAAFFLENDQGEHTLYMVHPENMKHRVENKPLSDIDHAWYVAETDKQPRPDKMKLNRMLNSSVWHRVIDLTRVTDDNVLKTYELWQNKTCNVVKLYPECEYLLECTLYAVTQAHLYIRSEREDEFYKVPRDAHKGFGNIQMGDMVGILTMGGKVYLAFEELSLYIPTTPSQLQKYGIKRVKQIE